ncbi:MAG: LamG domain-containing protein [Candidatus Bathyarchaeia archaeon]
MVLGGLVLYLPFDEGSGSVAYDESGNNNNGELRNNPTWVDGKLGKALYFNSSLRSYVRVPRSESIEPPNQITISAWVYYSIITTDGSIINKRYNSSIYSWSSYHISIRATDKKVLFRLSTDSATNLLSSLPLPPGWHHIVAVYDGSYMKIFIDGELSAQTEKTGTIIYDATQHLYIGTFDGYNAPFEGVIDEVRIYNRALSDAEVKWLYESSGARLGVAPLAITDFSESSEPVGAEWHAWEKGQVIIKRYVYGIKRTWQLKCIEKDIAWNNSAARYLQQKMAAGETVTLTINEGDRYTLPATTCHITGLELEIETTGTQNIRKFTITLKER